MIRFALLGLIFVVDQLLLPMFHLGGQPFKISYFLLGLWLLDWLRSESTDPERTADLRRMAWGIGGIILSAIVGDLWLASDRGIASYSDSVRSILIYLLMLLSFGLGQSARKFEPRWLTPVMFVAIGVNFLVIVFGNAFQGLVSIYYDPSQIGDVLAMERPRGIFGNPNVSMLQVNIIFLFVVLARRHALVPRTSMPVNVAILALPAILSIVLASRGELISSALISAVFVDTLIRERGRAIGQKAVGLAVLAIAVTVAFKVLTVYAANSEFLSSGLARVATLGKIGASSDDINSSVLRPLLVWDIVYHRFLASPIFGSGFNVSDAYPFVYSPTYFHNDWFRVIVTSGLIGLVCLLSLLRRFFAPLGLIALLPFALPGLTNTFLLAVPSVMFYFFMVGVLRERLRAQAHEAAIATDVPTLRPVGDTILTPV